MKQYREKHEGKTLQFLFKSDCHCVLKSSVPLGFFKKLIYFYSKALNFRAGSFKDYFKENTSDKS